MNDVANQEYKVKLEFFEGPLDLLLYLIKKNEVDIYNIPISLIASKYIEYLEMMKSLNLDIAGEFILMAATLAHIKSQMLVPSPLPSDDDGIIEDPRAALIKQLLEYQRYKDAASELLKREILNRDVFKRDKSLSDFTIPESERELVEVSIFSLIENFSKILRNIPEDFPHEFYTERLTIKQRIAEIAELLLAEDTKSIRFSELFADVKNKSAIIVTFLAALEMIKMNLVRATQLRSFGEIMVSGTNNLTNDWKIEDDFEESN